MFKDYPKRKDGTMVNIFKEELSIEESLRKKNEFICNFTNTKPTIINGSIRKIDRTNFFFNASSITTSCLIIFTIVSPLLFVG